MRALGGEGRCPAHRVGLLRGEPGGCEHKSVWKCDMENPWERIAEQIFGEGAEDQVLQDHPEHLRQPLPAWPDPWV